MTILEKSSALQNSLRDNRKKPRDPGPADYDAPTVVAPVLLGPTADDVGNQVQSKDQGLQMTLKFANLAAGGIPNGTKVKVQAKWGGSLVGVPVEGVTPLPPDWADDKRLVIPVNHTNQPGSRELTYNVAYGLNGKDSRPLTIFVDNVAPSLTAAISYPDEIKADGFTAEYFQDVSPYARLSYASTYSGAKIGDSVEFWKGEVGPDGEPVAGSTMIESVVLTTPGQTLETQKLTRELITIDEGTVDLFAYSTDRKGNRSAASPVVTVPVSMIPLPKNLALDIVLENGDVTDRDILFRDAQVPVHGEHKFLNWRAGDKLRRTIANQAEIVLDIDQAPPFFDTITYKELLDDGDLGAKELDYKYQIQRGTKLIPTSPVVRKLKVHLDKPGEQPDDPENPGLPGSPDPKLNIVSVRGVHPRENYLIKQDAMKNGALVRFKIYKGHKKNDGVVAHYQGVALPVLTLDGTETDDDFLEVTIPPEDIADGGNNKQMRVGYSVYHPDVNGSVSVAEDQHVDVYVNEITMPQPNFKVTGDPGNGDGQTVYCDSLVRDPDTNHVAVEVTFDPDPSFKDKEFAFSIKGYENVVDAGKNKPGNAIRDAIATVVKTPNEAEATAGFSVYFPHESFQKILNGWCELSCRTRTEPDGYFTPSDPRLFRVTMDHGDGSYCDLPPTLSK